MFIECKVKRDKCTIFVCQNSSIMMFIICVHCNNDNLYSICLVLSEGQITYQGPRARVLLQCSIAQFQKKFVCVLFIERWQKFYFGGW